MMRSASATTKGLSQPGFEEDRHEYRQNCGCWRCSDTRAKGEETDASLSSLALSERTNPVPFRPTFAATTTDYAASVAHSVASVRVTPTVRVQGATVTLDGSGIRSGSSRDIPLAVG